MTTTTPTLDPPRPPTVPGVSPARMPPAADTGARTLARLFRRAGTAAAHPLHAGLRRHRGWPAGAPAPVVPPDAAALARRIADLPPLPRALAEALRVLGHDEVPARACVEAIERDPALALRVLQVANSGFYAASARVATLDDAVRLLGLRTVAAVLTAVSLRGVLGRLPGELAAQEQRWRHALATAVAARELARTAGADPDEAFVAGLLHDVGGWLLAAFHPEVAAQAQAWARAHDVDARAAERQVLGVTHDDIGAQVARHWQFPPATLRAIAHHHAPRPPRPGAPPDLDALVHVADAVAHALDLAGDPDDAVPVLDVAAWAAMGLDDDALVRLLARTEDAAAAMAGA